MCLTTVIDRLIPPNYQDAALCGFIAATNIESISSHTMWSCTTDGLTSTNPCNASSWFGIGCSGSFITGFDLREIYLTGMCDDYMVVCMMIIWKRFPSTALLIYLCAFACV